MTLCSHHIPVGYGHGELTMPSDILFRESELVLILSSDSLNKMSHASAIIHGFIVCVCVWGGVYMCV